MIPAGDALSCWRCTGYLLILLPGEQRLRGSRAAFQPSQHRADEFLHWLRNIPTGGTQRLLCGSLKAARGGFPAPCPGTALKGFGRDPITDFFLGADLSGLPSFLLCLDNLSSLPRPGVAAAPGGAPRAAPAGDPRVHLLSLGLGGSCSISRGQVIAAQHTNSPLTSQIPQIFLQLRSKYGQITKILRNCIQL